MLVVVADYKQKPLALRKLMELFPKEAVRKVNQTEGRIDLINGLSIWVKSSDSPESLMGFSADFRWDFSV